MAMPMDPNSMPMDPNSMPMDPAAAQSGLDPALVEQMLGQAQTQLQGLDQAEDFEQVINAIRGDQAPLSARRDELAGMVGADDASATPESVLALIQPVMQMAAVDQGIGGLAAEQMNTPLEGPMAEGIMSMAMPSAPPAPDQGGMDMAGMGGPAPVNFNQGGAVQYMAPGGVALPDGGPSLAKEYFPGYQALYSDILGSQDDRDASQAETQRMSKAQMFFDIAQAGLQFAGETSGNTVGERLANAVGKSQLLPKIGERAAGVLAAKQASDRERQGMNMAALGSSIAEAGRVSGERSALARTIAGTTATAIAPEYQRVVGPDGVDLGTFNVKSAEGQAAFEAALGGTPGSTAFNLGTQPAGDTTFKTITLYNAAGDVRTLPTGTAAETAAINDLLAQGYTSDDKRYSAAVTEGVTIAAEDRKAGTEQSVYDRDRADKLADVSAGVLRDIAAEERALGRTLNTEERGVIEFDRRYAMETASTIATEERALGRTLNAEERANVEFTSRALATNALSIDAENRALANIDTTEIRQLDGQLISVDTATGEATAIFGEKAPIEPSLMQITIPNARGVATTSVVDINSPQGRIALENVNTVLAAGGQASVEKTSTASTTPRGFLVPGTGVVTTYDGGRTYLDAKGEIQNIPSDAFEVSNTIAYDVAKNETISANARASLEEMDDTLIGGMTDGEGNPLTAGDQAVAKDAFGSARLGTGTWSKVFAGIDSVVGGVSGGKLNARVDVQDARQTVRMIRVLGRSALAASPRFAVADLQATEQLFPNEKTLFTNPETEARKLVTLKTAINEEKRRILEIRASGASLDPAMNATLNQKLFEIERLNQMLGPVDGMFASSSNADAFNQAKDTMRQRVTGGR